MDKPRSGCTRFGWVGMVVAIIFVSLAGPAAAAENDIDSGALAEKLGAVFHRSMSHWKFDYTKLPNRKAGVACIPWDRLNTVFLDSETFQAIGFSYSMYDDAGAIKVATDGCKLMKAKRQVNDCDCEVVLLGETVAVTVPDVADD